MEFTMIAEVVLVIIFSVAHFSHCVPLTTNEEHVAIIIPYNNSTSNEDLNLPTMKQICLDTQTCCKPSQGASNSRCRCRDRVNLFGVSFNCDITTFPILGSSFMICNDKSGSGTCPP